MDDRDAVAEIHIVLMGMSIGLRDPAVSRPTGVRNTDRPGETSMSLDRFFEHPHSPDALDLIDRRVLLALKNRDSRRVIPSILKPLEPFEQNGGGIPMADIGDDSTHVGRSPDL